MEQSGLWIEMVNMLMGAYFVYMLQCKDGSLYTGYTTDVERRLKEHACGKGAKYTRGRGPFSLLHVEQYERKHEAMKREAQIKRMNSKQKWGLIQKGESKN